jgi:5-methylcytosine-specific restriction endonuclease McrA
MSRCTATRNLEVHHKNRANGNGLANAQVLCQACHSNTSSYGTPGNSPKPFTEDTKELALARAGHRCECTRDSCH